MTRWPLLFLPLLLVSCGGGASLDAEGDSRTIACGPVGAPANLRCTLSVRDEHGTLLLTLRQPEGGFRRLAWPKGRELTTADGAEPLATSRLPGGGVAVQVGGWAYRIEAKGGGLP